uniref:Sideroflexin-1 n=1 Tax=Hucho hucho TaxID=62062 RepID=A0A4W5PBL2_9TELE
MHKELSDLEKILDCIDQFNSCLSVLLQPFVVVVQHISPLVGRLVPFAAVAAANCINIPLMRQRELKHGIPITDENDNRLGESPTAAKQAISQVVVSRILMASPGMAIPPFLMNTLEKKAFLKVLFTPFSIVFVHV